MLLKAGRRGRKERGGEGRERRKADVDKGKWGRMEAGGKKKEEGGADRDKMIRDRNKY